MFPNPTADPAVARTNPALVAQCSLFLFESFISFVPGPRASIGGGRFFAANYRNFHAECQGKTAEEGRRRVRFHETRKSGIK